MPCLGIHYTIKIRRRKLTFSLFYAVIPIVVRISIIMGITTTNSMVLIMTRPVAKGKSDFASLATIGNTAITGPADCTTNVIIAIGSSTMPAPYCKPIDHKTTYVTTNRVFIEAHAL